MPRGIGSWRRRENSGRLVGSKLREEGRAESQSKSEWRVKWQLPVAEQIRPQSESRLNASRRSRRHRPD